MGSEKFGSWLSSTECFHNGDYSVSLIPRILYMTRPDKSFHFDVWVWPSINVNVSRTRNSNPPSEKELNPYIPHSHHHCSLLYKASEMKPYLVILNGSVSRNVNLHHPISLHLSGKECWTANETRTQSLSNTRSTLCKSWRQYVLESSEFKTSR